MVGPVKEQEVSVISVITGTCPHKACSQRLLFLTITSTTLHFLVPPSNFLLSVPYVIITRAVHRRRMDFIKLRCLLHIQGYMDTLAAQKGNNLPCIPQERKMLWLRKDHKKITPLYVLLHQFVLCCNVGRNQFFPQTILKHYEVKATNLGKQGSVRQNRNRRVCDLKSKRPGFESSHHHMETVGLWEGNSTPLSLFSDL